MSSTRLNVVQVIPIYYRTDEPANTVFSQHQDTLDAIFSGRPLVLALEEPLNAPAAKEVARTPVSERFPGLTHSDIPCLWVEAAGEHFFWRLHRHTIEDIHRLFRSLRDAVNDAKTLKEVEESMMSKNEQTTPAISNHPQRNPWVSGSFYLFAFLSVVALFRWLWGDLHPIFVPILLIGGMLVTAVIGAFTLRNQEMLHDKPFLGLVGLAFSQMPLLGNLWRSSRTEQSKPESES